MRAIEGDPVTSKFARRALSITGAAALTLIAALTPQAAFAENPVSAASVPSPSPSNPGPSSGLDGEQLESEVEAIPYEGNRDNVAAYVEDIVAQGGKVFTIASADYVATSVDPGDAEARAYPSGCGITTVISKSGLSITNGTFSSCSTSWNLLTHHMWIQARHPFTFEVREVQSGSDTIGAASSAFSSITWYCNNANLTWHGAYAYGVITKGGATYQSSTASDGFATTEYCGW